MCTDAQASLEKMGGFFSHLQCGVSNIWGVGQLESELAFSPAQAVIDDEMISYVKRYLQGVTINEDTLAVELSREVGISGSFLGTYHTMEHFQDELFQPSILFRKVRDHWRTLGSKTLTEVAEEKAIDLMDQDVENGLSEDQINELDVLATRFLREVKRN